MFTVFATNQLTDKLCMVVPQTRNKLLGGIDVQGAKPLNMSEWPLCGLRHSKTELNLVLGSVIARNSKEVLTIHV